MASVGIGGSAQGQRLWALNLINKTRYTNIDFGDCMRKVIFVALLGLVSSNAVAEWTEAGGSGDNTFMFYQIGPLSASTATR